MPTVVDASALADLLLLSPRGLIVRESIGEDAADLHIPHLADLEILSVLRGLVRKGTLTQERAAGALLDLQSFPASRWPATVLLGRMWQLRENLTPYEANYVALAEALNAKLITSDGKLARAATEFGDREVHLAA